MVHGDILSEEACVTKTENESQTRRRVEVRRV
jgi:hypothetical protein